MYCKRCNCCNDRHKCVCFTWLTKIIRTTFWSRHHKGLRSDDPDLNFRTVDGSLPAIDTVTTIVSGGDAVGADSEMKVLFEAKELDTLNRKLSQLR